MKLTFETKTISVYKWEDGTELNIGDKLRAVSMYTGSIYYFTVKSMKDKYINTSSYDEIIMKDGRPHKLNKNQGVGNFVIDAYTFEKV